MEGIADFASRRAITRSIDTGGGGVVRRLAGAENQDVPPVYMLFDGTSLCGCLLGRWRDPEPGRLSDPLRGPSGLRFLDLMRPESINDLLIRPYESVAEPRDYRLYAAVLISRSWQHSVSFRAADSARIEPASQTGSLSGRRQTPIGCLAPQPVTATNASTQPAWWRALTVDSQADDDRSMLALYRRALQIRRAASFRVRAMVAILEPRLAAVRSQNAFWGPGVRAATHAASTSTARTAPGPCLVTRP
jgi:hypothetical protein